MKTGVPSELDAQGLPGTAIDSRIVPATFVLIIAVILIGFAKNFYLRAWLGTRPLILTAWIHGFVMSAFLAVFTAQVLLVSRGRIRLHRTLGYWGAGLAALVVIVGVDTILVRTRIAVPGAGAGLSAAVFVAFDGLSLLLFGALVAAAMQYRRRPQVHRRLMTLAMVALLPPAFGRSVEYLTHTQIPLIVLGLMTLSVVAFVLVDRVRTSRFQRASVIAGVLIVAVNLSTYVAQVMT